jgi:predicted dehydrogenase
VVTALRQPSHVAGLVRPRVGIIGAGFIGGVHARAVRAAGGVLTRVAGRSPESAAIAAAGYDTEPATSAEALIGSDEVDVVHICTPNHLHASLARQALEAGKHVICEKPLATTLKDAEELARLADEVGLVATVPFVYRFYPTVREAQARIAAGDAGDLWMLHGSYLQDWLSQPSDTNWRVDPALGGASRAFADIGVHWCDLMEFTTGQRITRVSAVMNNAFPREAPGAPHASSGTEDGVALVFETDAGCAGSLVASQVTPGRKNRLWFSFDGSVASYAFDQENPDTLFVGGRTENRLVLRGPDTLSPEAARLVTTPSGHPQGYQDCFNAFVADTYAAVAGQAPHGLPTFADGLRAATLTAAVVESVARRSWVEVPA